jgi:hypothetical protein
LNEADTAQARRAGDAICGELLGIWFASLGQLFEKSSAYAPINHKHLF